MTPVELAAIGLPLLLIVSNTGRQAKALELIAKALTREANANELDRIRRDELARRFREADAATKRARP